MDDLFSTVLRVGKIPLLVLSSDLFIKKVSPTIAILFGIPHSKIMNQFYPSFCQNYHLQDLISPHLKVLSSNPEMVIEDSVILSIPKNKSNRCHIDWQIFALLNSDRQITGYGIIGKDAIPVNEQQIYLENIIACLPGSIYWKDRQGVYLGCNEVVVRMAGVNSPRDIIGKTDFDFCWKDVAEQVAKDEQEIMESGIAKDLEITGPLSDGTIATFITTKIPLRDHDGKVIGIVANSMDITHRKKMEKELQLAKEKAEKANKAKSEFIENMSHDIKTPLASMIGMTDVLNSKIIDPMQKTYVTHLRKSALQLLDLFNETLDILGKDTHEVPDKTRFNMHELLQSIIDFIRPSLYEKKLKFKYSFSKKINRFYLGNRSHIYRIILNLISNAVKFTNENGLVTLNVKVTKIQKNEHILRIKVSDSGIGIPKESQEIIFERYTRLTPAYEGKYKGSGLGLFIVKKMTTEIGATISVDSEFGKGSHFILDLPLQPNGEEKPVSIVNEKLNHVFVVSQPMSILLVEDNPIAQEITKELLSLQGCQVDIAPTGNEAIQKFKAHSYQLVFMDVGLPDISGFEVTRQMRNYENQHNKTSTQIMGLTAHVLKKDLDKGLRVGMDEIFSKPLTLPLSEEILKGVINPTQKNQKLITTLEANDHSKEPQIIDLELGAKILNSDRTAAEKMIEQLVAMLPEDLKKIKAALSQKDYHSLRDLAHYVKGGASYCGTPRLKNAAGELDDIIKNTEEQSQIFAAYQKLCDEITAVIKEYPKIKSQK